MSEHRLRLAVVILTWNGRDDTLACLASLRPQIGAGDAVIVCDNGSADGTEAAVRAAHPWAEFIQNGSNLGFAAGNNPGLRRAIDAGYEWVMLLNNDTTVPDGALASLLGAASKEPSAGAFQPLLVRASDPGVIDGAGHVIFRCPGAIDSLAGRPVAEAPRVTTSVFGACGAAALLRADALRQAGLLDEDFFVLNEDVDLMFRIRLAGWDVKLVPSVRILHRRGISGRQRDPRAARLRRFWIRRNSVAMGLRYWPARYLVLASPLLAGRIVQAFALSLVLPGQRFWAVWRRSWQLRGRCRPKMEERGLDRWFRHRPSPAPRPQQQTALRADESTPDESHPVELTQ